MRQRFLLLGLCGGMALPAAYAQAAAWPAGQLQLAVPTTGLAPGLYVLEAGNSRAQVVVE